METTKQTILIENSGEKFGIDIANVEKIIDFEKAQQIPETFLFMEGVITYQDKIIPIINLHTRLNGDKKEIAKESKVVIVRWLEKLIGLLVDSVIGIESLNIEAEDQVELQKMNLSQKYIEGFIKRDNDIIMVLDVDKLFGEEQSELLENIIDGN